MAKFEYVISDDKGIKEEGAVQATTRDSALEKVRTKHKGKIVISVSEKGRGRMWVFGRPSLSMQDKMIFIKNLATMIKVGVTITESLGIIIDQTKSRSVKKMYEDILDRVRTGESLANSLKRYDNVFTELFINMIDTGEKSGTLDKVLEYLDAQLEKEYELKKKIISAFIYPAVIIGITLLMAMGIVIFIMPKITRIFESFAIDLPLPTRVLIGFSNFLTQNPVMSAVMAVGTVVGLIVLFKLKFMKPFWHHVILHLPVFGDILVAANVARFSRTFNSLLSASVPITDALKITANMLDNALYKKALESTAEKVEKGGKLGDSFDEFPKLFPTLATKLIYVGEKTGSLILTTEKVAQLYEQTVDTKTKNLSVLLEPFLLVFMAILVGGIAISIIMPIYQLPNMLQR